MLLSMTSKRLFSASAVQSFTWDRPFLTSNRFVLIQNPFDQLPFIKLNYNSKPIHLKKELTLRELEMQLKSNGDSKDSTHFIAPDGAFISKGTKIHHLLHIPYFVMKIDGHRVFNVMSEKSFSLRNQKFTLNAHERRIFDTCRALNIRD